VKVFPHDAEIVGCLITKDFSRVLTWGGRRFRENGGALHIWDVNRPEHPVSTFDFSGPVDHVALSRDEKRLLITTHDGTASLWDPDHSTQPLMLFTHDRPIYEAIFSPDEAVIATRSEDKTVRLWNAGYDANQSFESLWLDFQIRSATTLSPDGTVRILKASEL